MDFAKCWNHVDVDVDRVVIWYMASGISVFFGDHGSGFDMKYGIMDQLFLD